ncbi:MAG: serine/threonine protein kinase [Planctomycetales bacterium]|nr:serine/threonine protein kinase [Planctomycetales bacterium]
MNSDGSDSTARDQRINEAISQYLAAIDTGRSPDREALIAQFPDVADELSRFFADDDEFARRMIPLQNTLPLPRPASRVSGSGPAHNALPTSHRPEMKFGDYELIEEVARGGMGIVYRARQTRLNRTVALKMILAGRFASQDEVQRFHAEAEAVARLDHPGIVPIFEVGEVNGQHYFSMGYVEGCSLADWLREGPAAPRDAAEFMKQVCEAVHHAHEHGIVHRDLKPANILLSSASQASGDRDEVHPHPRPHLTQFFPRVTDFGLAKQLSTDSHLTRTGQLIGTLHYMSPEQASSTSSRAVGPASDIYSLGVILYHLLTGRTPFDENPPLERLVQVVDTDAPSPRVANREIPRELEAICLKCLQRQPAGRYDSARELGEDLQRFLDGEPVMAAKVNVLNQVTRVFGGRRYDEHFRGWGLGLMAFGLVIFLSHVAIYFIERSGQATPLTFFATRGAMFTTLIVVLWRFRYQSLLPTKSAERLIYVVWLGYLLALGVLNGTRFVLGHDQRESYASFAVLAGFGFLIMGSHVWGGGYVVGLAFMLAAPWLAYALDTAPVLFGALWAAALWTFGIRYFLRGRVATMPSKETDGRLV